MDTVSTEHIAKDPSASTRRLEGVRARLLDAARDSYLFHTPPGGESDHEEGRGPLLELKSPDLDRVFHHLLGQDDPLTFRPLHGGDGKGPAPSQTFGLAADLPRPHLSRSLAALHEASRARVRKAGTHQLALALGFLDWVEGDGEEEVVRRSPLVLVPVRLEASDESESEAGARVRRAGSAAVRNELLAHVLRKDHWVELPAWRPAAGAAPVADFLDQIRGAIAGRTRWAVDSDAAVLACFDGEAFLHYLDLDPVSWRHGTAPSDHEIVSGLLGGLFYTGPAEELDPLDLEDSPFESSPFEGFSGPGVADHLLGNQTPGHVLDADGHQALGIEEARQGLSLILTGRSGSGRTQTVANMVAGAARDGQRVLVVSGRPDDLDDLRGRLDEANLEPLTLGVYGMQASREAVLDAVAETLDAVAETLDQPDRKPAPAGHTVQRLRAVQQRLNAHAQQMHYPHSFAGISAYEIAGWMARLLTRGREPLDVPMEHVREWDKASLSNATDHLARLAKHVEGMGNPRVHPWRGVGGHGPEGGVRSSDEPCPEEVRGRVAAFHEQLSHWERRVRRLAARLCVRARGIGDVSHMVSMAGRIVRAPDVDRKAIRSPVWRRRAGEIQALVRNGQRLEDVRDQVDPLLISAAWKEDLSQVRQVIKARGDSMLRWASPAYRQARARLKGLAQNQPPGSTTEQVRLLDTLDRGREALRQVESQDELGREAFGRHWRGADSEWAHLTSIIHWMAEATSPLSDNVPGALARTVDAKGLARLAADAEAGTEDIVAGFLNLAAVLDVDLQEAFDCESLEQIPLATLKERLDDWAKRPERHQEWITYLAWEREARDLGLDPFADRLADGSLVPDEAVDVFHL
ncbi:MAG: DUF4011 domain-containing protein, partial [Gemmatimonadetes bacterium]|nr:DUF4011 domain-containing protein [Gemmatimonadota bacterium]